MQIARHSVKSPDLKPTHVPNRGSVVIQTSISSLAIGRSIIVASTPLLFRSRAPGARAAWRITRPNPVATCTVPTGGLFGRYRNVSVPHNLKEGRHWTRRRPCAE